MTETIMTPQFRNSLFVIMTIGLSSCTHLAASRTAQYRAAHAEDITALSAIADAEINLPTANGTTLLMAAARYGKLKSVEYLLSRKANPTLVDNDQQNALHYSLSAKAKAVDEALIRSGADPSRSDRFDVTPVLEWAERGDFDLVRLGLENSSRWTRRDFVRKELKQMLSTSPALGSKKNEDFKVVQKILFLP